MLFVVSRMRFDAIYIVQDVGLLFIFWVQFDISYEKRKRGFPVVPVAPKSSESVNLYLMQPWL